MAEQFHNQGGAANSDPNPFMRWLTSKLLTNLVRLQRLTDHRSAVEKQRRKSGHTHVVEYFHQLDDGYSHLAAQVLPALAERYAIQLECHLVIGPFGDNAPEPELLRKLSHYDASHIATEYGLTFPEHSDEPRLTLQEQATAILAAQDSECFIRCAAAVGTALWADDDAAMTALAEQYGTASKEQMEAKLEEGTARRTTLKHYSGAMFYYGGEWYWGVDRLYHLEKRLVELNANRQTNNALLVPRPTVEVGPLKDNGSLTLEVYVSLRSPYTAIVFDSAVRLAGETGVKLVVRPVLPMVMRGVPTTREKGLYIFTDAAREAREQGKLFGNMYDPIGDPVRRAYSLYPWACQQGKGIELLSSFLRCAWVEGVNTNNDKGLKAVVEKAGLDWEQAKNIVGLRGWEEELENNRLAMYEFGLWGVPGFRLLNEKGERALALWGQDRLWLVAREIQCLLQTR